MSGAAPGPRAALFVDRDGTIIREREYLSDPAGVELLPGAVAGLRRFAAAGYAIVVVTNQSGIARGLYGETEYQRVEREVEARLSAEGIHVEGSFHCPHHPDFTGPCDCRKPATGLFRRAAESLGLDLARSVYVGDRPRDAEPALELGGVGVMVRTGHGFDDDPRTGIRVADDLQGAADAVGL